MLRTVRIPAIIGGSLVFIWWAFFTHVKNEAPEDLYSYENFQEDASTIYSDLGQMALNRGNFQQAIKSFQESVTIRPDWLEGYDQLGTAYELNGQTEEALKAYAQAMTVNPSFLEYRFFCCGAKLKNRPAPELAQLSCGQAWTGQDLTGKKIFVYAEKEIGDTIMFCRFLKKLSGLAGKVYFKPQDSLVSLIRSSALGPITVCGRFSDLRKLELDYHCSLLSLQHYLNCSLEEIRSCQHYLTASEEKTALLSKTLFPGGEFKIGIVWQGDPEHPNDHNRSIPLDVFYPICRIKGARVYSLQTGHGTQQLDAIPKDVTIINLEDENKDLTRLAAIISQLNLVIGVEGTAVHLAGAMGKEVWLLMPHVTDWRWLGYAEKLGSIWYPQLYKLRQPYKRAWNKPMAHAVEKVQLMLKNRTS